MRTMKVAANALANTASVLVFFIAIWTIELANHWFTRVWFAFANFASVFVLLVTAFTIEFAVRWWTNWQNAFAGLTSFAIFLVTILAINLALHWIAFRFLNTFTNFATVCGILEAVWTN